LCGSLFDVKMPDMIMQTVFMMSRYMTNDNLYSIIICMILFYEIEGTVS
jgi:hypothetical protein